MTAQLTFNDDFNSLSLWNGSSGTWSTTTAFVDPKGNGSSLPSNGEQQWYINANYAPTASVKPWTVNNGVLTLTAQKADPSIQQYLGYSQAGLPAMGSYKYTSGLIETNHSLNQTYGYFEIKAQLPAGQGLWPAFWLMPSNGAWPPELDVMEALGKDTTTAYASVHTNQTGSHTSQGMAANVGDFSTGYHTYAVDWESDKITFFYDNKQIFQVATPADMHGPMYMIANLAMGGGWAGSVDSTTPFPAQMKIDYIRAWDSNPYTNGGAIPPASPPPPPPASAPTSPPPPASGGGVTLTGSGYHDVLTGGAGNDTLVASLQGSGTLTGGSGADVFQFGKMPWTPSHITDFQPGVDKLDLHALYPTYTGSDPIRDGYVSLADDGHGGTNVLVDPDGRATGQLWPTYVVDLDHVSPAGLTSASLFGGSGSTTPTAPTSPPPPTAPVSPPPPTSDGVTLTGSGYGYNLTGGAGNDTLIGSTPGSGTMTGGAGADIFRFGKMPWTPSHITDFQVGVDKLDLHGLYPTYTGADPVRDGYVSLADDGHGGTNVLVDPDGRATGQLWPTYVVDLDHVSKASLAAATNWVM
jgi:beta-glucanase (GH16 family)